MTIMIRKTNQRGKIAVTSTDCNDNKIKLSSAVINEQGFENVTVINISLWYMTVYPFL